jgi:hypothetical protein
VEVVMAQTRDQEIALVVAKISRWWYAMCRMERNKKKKKMREKKQIFCLGVNVH